MTPGESGMKQVALLTNPAAGHGKAVAAGRRALARFRHHDVQVRALAGGDAGESAQLAADAVADARARIPAWRHDPVIFGPEGVAR